MNIRILASAILLLPAGIGMAQDAFRISGKLSPAGKDRQIVLHYTNEGGKGTNDTVFLKKGKFTFSGTTAFANKAYLTLIPAKGDTSRRAPDSQEFYLEGTAYKVAGKDSLSKAKITGGQTQAEFVKYTTWMGSMPNDWRLLGQRYYKVMATKDSVAIAEMKAYGKELFTKMEATLDSFIFTHPNSYVSLDLVNENKTMVIDPATFGKYYDGFSDAVLASFNGKKLTAKYNKARQIAIGQSFDFTQDDVNGKPFSLASMRGKYVLVDFWASWCVPCRAENPNLLKAYNLLKDKKFEIVGISVDESKAAWVNAVQKDGMPWIQVSDLKGFKNEVAVKYGITAVPQNLLVDPNGVIIAKNLRGEDLYKELEKLIK